MVGLDSLVPSLRSLIFPSQDYRTKMMSKLTCICRLVHLHLTYLAFSFVPLAHLLISFQYYVPRSYRKRFVDNVSWDKNR
ncbi:hypothetical protein EI94DRAFT_1749011 [Lactarius quietus]|nr:hypothetical protein EI94DRAFT_1749011 [Lactarius quietus]